ncbi:histone-lysine N-methyltransferase SETMAR [Plakobranchus ocellatus]|uniref:Histone-lysine N-methyltransferase SETMAR n=1 Tax=Plakobranchus ocellatus TaxID=259542 RepID=A0AAV3Z3N9_9GAST|nr:histone-lysine N-methyltransferase SETMAR [Plakobranchus ocellatus]
MYPLYYKFSTPPLSVGGPLTSPLLSLLPYEIRGVSGTVDSESAQIYSGTLLSQFRAPPLASWPDEGLES